MEILSEFRGLAVLVCLRKACRFDLGIPAAGIELPSPSKHGALEVAESCMILAPPALAGNE